MRKLLTFLLALSPLTLASVADAAPVTRARVIITFAPGADPAAEAAKLRVGGGRITQTYQNVMSGVAVDLPAAAVAGLSRNPNITRVETDIAVTASDIQSPVPSWGLDRVDQTALPLSGSYTYPNGGSGVTVYVLDTGVRSDHNDFGGRVATGYSVIADGNGTEDCQGHGTHVAGTIAGSSFGVAKQATIIPVRVLDCSGSGSMSGVIAGLDWIAGHHTTFPAVANMSLGGGASLSLDDAVRRVITDGVQVAVAAGNSSADACTSSPARTAEAVTVGASTSTDAKASYSNFGTCLDLFAPGSSITSAWYTSTTASAVLSGTSMAAPHVTGAMAVLLAQNPTLTPQGLASLLVSTSTTGALSSAGTGSPNQLLYVNPTGTSAPAASAPTAPTGVKATAAKRAASVSWVRGSDGGAALTGQTVHVYSGGVKVAVLAVSSSATSAKITGLTAGRSYSFTVSATNSVGQSPESTMSNTVIPTR